SRPYTASTEGHGGPWRKALIHSALRVLPGCWSYQRPVARCDYRNHEAPAVADQFLIRVRVVLADLFGHPGKVELDGPADRVLEVYEERPVLRAEHVPRVRLTVQQLLGGAPVDDRPPQAPQRVGEQLPVRVRELRRDVAARSVLLIIRDSIHEVRRRDVYLPHAGMESLERLGVCGWRELSR